MTTYFKKISRSWAPRKSSLMKSRPQPSLFSFTMCLTVVLSFSFGFSGGYISALSPKKHYSSIYQGLLEELEDSRRCIEKEKLALRSLKEAHQIRASLQGIAMAR